MIQRLVTAVALALLLLAGLSGAALANPDNKKDSEERDGQSRHESGPLNHVPLVFGDNDFMRMVQVVMLLREVAYISTTALGVDFTSDDRVGLGGLPVLGGLFDKTYDADDFTEENRIGSVFRSGDDTMAVVLTGDSALDGQKIVFFNGKGHYEVVERPRLTEVSPASLLQLGTIPSMEQLIRGQAAKEVVRILAGITATTTPSADSKLPVMGDMPLLQSLFVGTAHEGEDDTLLIMLRPSIVMGDESS
ncbi:hypothetical protein HBA54_20740 [Pelagibius litoralis]|uniref:Type II/III secretion system secretin-like domain-containing protein n=1 Tax=Pelagibius litoralis TaxID=374515 RepID=A0A967F134_9PROT|nr:hypothetical protein [Pelagibius litoralis]NIA71031.1 hypothetical protein [Pelagibius litoralis]